MATTASAQQGLDLLRASTIAFIADDPTTISLIPSRGTSVEKPGGGYDYMPGTVRAEQEFKVISQSASDGIAESDGAQARSFDFIIVGQYDAAIEIGDRWTDGNNWYEVMGILPENGYERKASVKSLGAEPNYG